MALTKETRDKLPESDFAVPEKRALPIHDETHTRMAWSMLDKTKDLTPEEKASAKERILKRAHELGMDTSDWEAHHVQAQSIHLHFEAMAIEMPVVKNHPNRIPFTGILCRVDEPSDNPLNGSDGKRVILPRKVAEKALPSLMGMGLDYTPDFSGHDAKRKIGIITSADIRADNGLYIAGFFYGSDFPNEVKRIQAEKSRMGFSYEAQATIESMDDDPWIIRSCDFTGAAVLYKNKAAYTSTALAAQAETIPMEQLDKILEKLSVLDSINERIEKLEAAGKEKISASAEVRKIVEPHASRLHAAADEMARGGIGMHASRGHVAAVRGIADHMMAEAAEGKMPHIYETQDFLHASAAHVVEAKPSKEVEDLKAQMKDLSASLGTQLEDIKKKQFEKVEAPARKSVADVSKLPRSTQSLLAKNGINPSDGEKLSISDVDKMLAASRIKGTSAFAAKLNLAASGLIDPSQSM